MKRYLENAIKGVCMRLGFMQGFYIILVVALLQGCLNVNLKSVLPDQTFYSLDNVELENQCKKKQESFALQVNALSPYDSKDILLYNEKNEIKVLTNYKWIDLPKNMTRNAFIKVAANHCLQIDQNPPLSQRLNTLRISINDLYVKGTSDYEAKVYLTYELLGYDMKRIKEGSITTSARGENPAITLRYAMNEALQKIAKEIKK